MADKPTTAWDEAYPAGTTKVNKGDDAQRETRSSVREVVAADHKMESSGQGADWGYHKWMTLIESADLGTGVVGFTILGSQTVGGKGELTYIDEDDNDIQLTNAGFINAAALSTGVFATVALDNIASCAINASLLPGTDDSIDLGSAAKQWKDIYFNQNIIADGTTISAADLARLAGVSNTTIQAKNVHVGTGASGTTAIPRDNTIPQNTEGTEFMTLAITPKSATNLLKIEVTGYFSCATAGPAAMALFQDTTADALKTSAFYPYPNGANTGVHLTTITHWMVAGTTSETTFKARAGMTAVLTLYLNQYPDGTDLYGGTMASTITITEYSA